MQSSRIPSAPTARRLFPKCLRTRHGGVLLFSGLFILVSQIIRLGLFLRSWETVSWDWSLPASFLIGFGFDCLMAMFFSLPLAVLFALVPARWFSLRWFHGTIHTLFVAALALMIFGAIAEWVFWNEFYVRFNFIAVDYLAYTREIVGNVWQTFNLPVLALALFGTTGLLYGLFLSTGLMRTWLSSAAQVDRGRWLGLLLVLFPNTILASLPLLVSPKEIPPPSAEEEMLEKISLGLRHFSAVPPNFDNAYNTELAKNGEFALLAAYLSNDLNYPGSYPTLPRDAAFARLRELLAQDNTAFLSDDVADITRRIASSSPERRLNVIHITVESLGADNLSAYRDTKENAPSLTPNLDRITRDSVWFKNFYASGTRTVRGIEALILSIPPIPGQAILRRPDNDNLFTVGSVFQERGYDTAFIYGGSGSFDNMSGFFSGNGFRVIDKEAKLATDHPPVTFENIWGVCDEDLFDWALTEADRAHVRGENFYHFVMTLSNHRPYTWPEGRIDIPSGAHSREGGVKYSDYALGRFLEQARTRPWFNDTVFVITADHGVSVAGAQEFEVKKYATPLIIYSPAHFPPRRIDTLCSQVDFAPTLFGLLNWNYTSRFLGRDALRASAAPDRAFLSNYQKLGLLTDVHLAALKPVALSEYFLCDRADGKLTEVLPPPLSAVTDAIAYFQCASELLSQGRQKNLTSLPPAEKN